MKNVLRRGMAWLLSALMMLSCMPTTALAAIVPVEATTQTSDGISLAGVLDPTQDVYITFNFYDGETLVSTQIVKDQETVYQPTTPAVPEGKKFLGWYVGDTEFTFGAQNLSGYAESTTVDVKAKYSDVYYAYFMTVDGTVYKTLEATSENNFTVTAPDDYEPAGKRVTNWKSGEGEEVAPGASATISADTTFTAETVDCVWVTYDTDGAGHIASQYADKGANVTLSSETPTRTGYTFGGWTLTKGSTTRVTSISNIQEDTMVYAIWNAADVNYTVVYWGENANDENYSPLASVTKQAKTDSEQTLDASSGALPSSVTDRSYFTFEKSDTVTINADGSSVLNVYFTRNEYTITFDLIGDRSFSTAPVLTMNGQTYTGTYSFTAKYEQDISTLWPTAGDFTTLPTGRSTTYQFKGWNNNWVSKRLTLTSDIISAGTVSAYWSSNLTEYTLNYMFETPDGTGTAYTYNGTTRYYKKSEEYSQTAYTSRNSTWSAKAITGFTSVDVDQSGTTVNLYYSRNSYDLTLNNYGTTVSQNSILYEASLSSYETTPARPEGFSENAEFKGWYTVEPSQVTDSTVAFDFNTTMPAHDVILYAKWEEPKIEVNLTVNVDVEGLREGLSLDIPAGSSIKNQQKYTEFLQKIADAGYTVLKWVDNDTGDTFDVSTMLYEDTNIRAVLKGTYFTVTYELGDGTGTAPVDSHKYESDTEAKVLAFTGTAPSGKVFAYWEYTNASTGTTTKYYPGQGIKVTGNVILKAVYDDRPTTVQVTYHSNYDPDATYTSASMQENSTVTVATYDATGLASRTGYTFQGWATTAGGEVKFAAGSSARLTAGDDNDLYAVWAANTDVSYTVHYYKEGTTESVAADKTVSGQTFDSTVTENAVSVTGYTAVDPTTQSITLDAYNKEITFYYTVNQYAYTVEYYIDGTKDDTLTATGTAAYKSTVSTYTDKCPSGYVLDKTENLPLTITENEDTNVIKVYYKKNVFNLTVNYVYEDGTTAADTHTESVTYGNNYSVTSPSIDGYTCDKEVVAGTMPENNVTETVTYTKRNDLSYTVYYYLNGTTTPVQSSRTVDKQTFNALVTESPATIGGYTAVSNEDKSITITTGTNEIIFYYYKNVTLTANSATEKYDGNEKSVSGYTADTTGVTFEGIEVGATGKDAATYNAEFPEGTVGTVDTTSQYIVAAVNNGTLTIDPRTVHMVSGTATKEWDGTALTAGVTDVHEGYDGFVSGEGADYTVTGAQTLVGASVNAFTYALKEGTKAQNYTITKDEGTLTVTGDKIVPGKTTEDVTANYKEGDEIPFVITVRNVSTDEVTNVTVTDTTATIVEGEGYTVSADGHTATIASIAADTTIAMVAKHTVTQDDILAAKVGNTANVTWPDGEKTVSAETKKIVEPNFDLGVQKTSDVHDGTIMPNLGEKITYTITVTNIGNIDYPNVKIADTMDTSDGATRTVTNITVTEKPDGRTATINGTTVTVDKLAVGEHVTITATYTVQEADILAGEVTNNVTATVDPITYTKEDGTTDTKNISVSNSVTDDMASSTKKLSVSKDVPGEKQVFSSGDTIEYAIIVRNAGNTTLSDATLTIKEITVAEGLEDAKFLPDKSGHNYYTVNADNTVTVKQLEPYAGTGLGTEGVNWVTVYAQYTVTEEDLLNGKVKNVVTASSTDPDVDPETATKENVTEEAKYDLSIEKTILNEKEVYKLGDQIQYQIKVTAPATNNMSMTDMTLVDTLIGAWAQDNSYYTIGELPEGVTFDNKQEIFYLPDTVAGQAYEVVITYTYTVQESDLGTSTEYGEVPNQASIGAELVADSSVKIVESDEEYATTDKSVNTLQYVKKSTDNKTEYALGETIHYTITVSNTGNKTVTEITVKDDIAAATITEGTGYTIENNIAKIASLKPGESVTVNAEYTVTSDDILAGKVANTATVTGKEDPDVTPGGSEDDTEDLDTTLTVTKTSDKDGQTVNTGDEINYTITVKNDGNVPYSNVVVTDDLAGLTIATSDKYTIAADGKSVTIASLAVDETVTITATYTVTEADILAGKVLNSVTAKANDVDDPKNPDTPKTPEGTSENELDTEDPVAELTLDKVVTNAHTDGSPFALGEKINYKVTVTASSNNNLTLTNVVIGDSLLNIADVGSGYITDITPAIDNWTKNNIGLYYLYTVDSLKPGESVTITYSYTVQTRDLGSNGQCGTVKNQAVASADTPVPTGDDVPTPATPKDDEQVTTDTQIKLTITAKDATYAYDGDEHGENGYTNTTLRDGDTIDSVTIEGSESAVGEYEGKLVPGNAVIKAGTEDVTKYYAITYVAGKLIITGDEIIPTKTTQTVTSNYKLGDKIPFNITVANASKDTVENVTVVDNNATIIAGDGYTVSADGHTATIATISSSEVVIVKAEHTVTSDDILAGTVGNEATVSWGDTIRTVSAHTEQIEEPRVEISVVKYSDVEFGTTVGLGDTIYYAYWVQNTGNVPYTAHLTDELVGWSTDVNLAVGGTSSKALPLENAYTVTEADIAAGKIVNTITATVDPIEYTAYEGNEPVTKSTDTVTESATVTDYTDAVAYKLTAVKASTDGKAEYALGDTIHYTITVKNEGNQTVTNVVIADTIADATIVEGTGYTVADNKATIASLKPNASVVVNATYTVTSDDILVGKVVNDVTVTANENPDTETTPDTEETEDLDTTLTVKKTSDKDGLTVKKGDKITYTITVKNDGNVPYTNVKVVDELEGLTIEQGEGYTVSGDTVTIASLAVGETVTITATYTVTGDDELAGKVLNSVTAKGDEIPDPDDPDTPKTPEGEDETEDKTDKAKAELTIEKTVVSEKENGVPFQAGDVIEYQIVVTAPATNSGIIKDVELRDALLTEDNLNSNTVTFTGDYNIDDGGAYISLGDMAPGDTKTITYTYTVQESDLGENGVLGEINNTATVKGTAPTPTGADVEKPDDPEETDTTTSYTAIKLTITANNNSVKYDGNEHGSAGYDFGTLRTGDKMVDESVTVSGGKIYVGEYEGELVPSGGQIIDASNKDVTAFYAITYVAGNLTITGDEVIPEKTTPDVTSDYKLGAKIPFTITVSNVSDAAIENVTVVDNNATIIAGEGYTVSDDGHTATIATIASGATVTVNAEHTVTSDDILAGTVGNEATVSWGDKTREVSAHTEQIEEPRVEISVEKYSDAGTTVGLGDTIHYAYWVKNTGNVPYTAHLTDELVGWSKDVTLAVGVIDSYSLPQDKAHTVTEADIAAGKIVNTITATVDPIEYTVYENGEKVAKSTDTVTESATVTDYTVATENLLTIQKESTEAKEYKLGETIEYTIAVANNGNQTLTNIVIADTIADATIVEGTGYTVTDNKAIIAELKPSASVVVNATYTVTSDDILKGEVVNSVTATANENPEIDITPATDETEDLNTTLTVTKTSDKTGKVTLGETINYTITVKNEGNVPFYNVKVDDDLTNLHKTIDVLAVGETVEYTTTYTVTSDDILKGSIVNNVTAKGDDIDDPKNPGTPKTPEDDDTVTDETDDVDTTLTVKKSSTLPEGKTTAGLGDTITYEIAVKNEGNVPYTNVKVVDALEGLTIEQGEGYTVSGDTVTIDSLAVGAYVTIKATYTVTSDDILKGKVTNAVTATADPVKDPKNPDAPKTPSGTDEVTDETDDLDTTLTVTKTADPAGEVKLGDTITYTITVKNDGNVPYYNVLVNDPLVGLYETIGVLAVGESKTYTRTYTVSSDDILRGSIVNNVTAKGDPITDPKDPEKPKTPEGEDEIENNTESLKVNLTATKTNDVPAGTTAALGQKVTYTITVKNEGNVPNYNVVVTDPMTNSTWIIDELGVGQSKTFNTTHTITEEDIAPLGFVTNVVTAKGDPIKDPADGSEKVPEATASSTVNCDPLDTTLTVTKESDKAGKSVSLNDLITYTIKVKNDGNHSYTNVVVNDPMTGFTTTITKLAVGEEKTFTTTHIVTEADVLAGKVVNSVTAKGDPIWKRQTSQTPEGSAEVTDNASDPQAKLTITKTVTSTPENGVAYKLGEKISYKIVVSTPADNNTTVKDVTISDEMLKVADRPVASGTMKLGAMAPGKTLTVTYTYTVKDTDLGSEGAFGSVKNAATVSGTAPETTDPDRKPEDPTDTDETDTKTVIALTITAHDGVYDYDGQPHGENGYDVEDLRDGDQISVTIDGSETLVGEYEDKLVPKDAVITDAENNDVTDLYEITYVPGDLTINGKELIPEKEITNLPTEGNYKLGDKIQYTITVENVSAYEVKDVSVQDENGILTDGTGYTVVSEHSATIASIPANSSVVVNAYHTVTSDDILAGTVNNKVNLSWKNGEKDVTAEDEIDTDKIDSPDTTLVVEKISDCSDHEVGLGEVIPYTIKVTNKGNVPFYNVKVDDDLTNLHKTIDVLAVGATETFTTLYVVNSDDIKAGKVLNIATAQGDPVKDPKDPDTPKTPKGQDEVTNETDDLNTKLTVTKTSNMDGKKVKLGETITYTITVKNEGNVPYTNVNVDDDLTNLHTTIKELAVDATETFITTYTVTSDDIKAGKVLNSVTAKGDPIDDPKDPKNPKTPEGTGEREDETDDLNTKLTVTKTSDKEGKVKLGETITYTITVKNEGNVPYTNVSVADTMDLTGDANRKVTITNVAGAGKGNYTIDGTNVTIKTLAVGQTVTITATYTVTEADVLNGKVLNNATATGDSIPDPKEDDPEKKDKTPEDDDDETNETEEPKAEVAVEKTVETKKENGKPFALGDEIEYKLTITTPETNNVTVKNVKVTDALLTKANESALTINLPEGASKAYDADGNIVITLADIPTGANTVIVTYTYTVQKSDLGSNGQYGNIHNAVTVAGTTPDPTDEDVEKPEDPTDTDETDSKTAIQVTITTKDITAEYDGQKHTATGTDGITSGDLQPGHVITDVEYDGGQIHAGNYPDEIKPSKVVIKDEDGNDVTDHYEITVEPGDLTITQRELVITAGSYAGDYDEQWHEVGYTVENLVETDTITALDMKDNKEIVPCELTPDFLPETLKITHENGEDSTNDYKVTYIPGSLVINTVIVKYKVMYYYDGVYAEGEDGRYTGEVLTQVTSYYGKCKDGWMFDHVDNLPLTLGLNEAENIISVYYVHIPMMGSHGTHNVGDCIE